MSNKIFSLGNAGVYGQSQQLTNILQHVPAPFLVFKAKLKYPKNKPPKIKAPKLPKIKTKGTCIGGGQQQQQAPQPIPIPVPVPQQQQFGGFPQQQFGGFPQQQFGGFPQQQQFGGFPQQQFGGFPQQQFGGFPQQQQFGGFPQQQRPQQQHIPPPIPIHTLAMTQRQIRRMYRKAEKGKAPKPCTEGMLGGGLGL